MVATASVVGRGRGGEARDGKGRGGESETARSAAASRSEGLGGSGGREGSRTDCRQVHDEIYAGSNLNSRGARWEAPRRAEPGFPWSRRKIDPTNHGA